MFEKLGWMVLAHSDGDKKHIDNYIENLEYLLKHVQHKKMSLTKMMGKKNDLCLMDKISDLEIMEINIMTLHKYAKKMCK
jgi:hypothetical protein